jgi:hypothetical protein
VLAASILPILLGALAVAIVLLFIGGYYANSRRNQVLSKRLHAEIEAADAALAAARAQDRGWEREIIETAARDAFTARRGGGDIRELHLVEVVDHPGTDADQAVFRVLATDGTDETIVLGRREGSWVPADTR